MYAVSCNSWKFKKSKRIYILNRSHLVFFKRVSNFSFSLAKMNVYSSAILFCNFNYFFKILGGTCVYCMRSREKCNPSVQGSVVFLVAFFVFLDGYRSVLNVHHSSCDSASNTDLIHCTIHWLNWKIHITKCCGAGFDHLSHT